MLLMVMLFYWVKQREASCKIQKQKKTKATQNITSNNVIRMSTKNRRCILAACNMTACPKPNLFSKLLAQPVLEESVFSENWHAVLSSKSKKAYFISLRNFPCFLYKFKMFKTSRVCWILTQFKSTVHFWGTTAKCCEAKTVHIVKFRKQMDYRDLSTFNLNSLKK